MKRDTVYLTGVLRTHATWGDGYKWPSVGDAVDDEWYMYFLEVLPPATMVADLIQIGEPHDHRGANGAARFDTIQKFDAQWIYTGHRSRRNSRVAIGGRDS